ncbi:hypothetical protein GCK72_021113 [Caenorhabditis remanei]|uniref:F-box domain-containing protein n=1 Tax=Caenorhabditis remanei TaxID=31234 RepID=A0A6A5GH89_CAERE|nr:hypothetical protein GCK72_021113 [Caenorhabditis remanei]KAF1754550.1 hypothetical protein GCK72_021113 [Caenorhabditis remanei]
MTTPFPLLRLPRLALIPVFQQMEFIDVIAFSLLSKRTYNLSKSLCKKVSSRDIDLEIDKNCLRIKIALTDGSPLILYFHTDVSKTVEVFYRKNNVQWKNVVSSPKQWIQRVFDVTKCPSLNKLILNGTPDYDVISFLNVVPKISYLHISRNCTNSFAIIALQIFSPVTSKITLSKLPYSNREEFQRFWLRDVDCLTIYADDLSSFQFKIDDLLASNAVKLELSKVPLSLRELNRFFSCWLNKTSNHRLERLSVKSLEYFDEDVLLEGLNATRFTENQTRKFRSTSPFYQFCKLTGGFNVRRVDGKLAAITLGNFFEETFINFDVWS